MYCGHCGAAVEEHDRFCPSCGARFVDPQTAAEPAYGAAGLGAAVAGAAAAGAGVSAAGGAAAMAAPPGGEPTMFAQPPPAFDAPEPTQLIPLTTGPGGRGARPFLIGAAFALIVVAGIVAFFLLRGDDSNAQPSPTGPTSPIESTTTVALPPVETTLPVTVAPETSIVETTVPPPAETVAPTAPPDTTPTSGTVPANTATIPGAPPTSAATPPPPATTTKAPPKTSPRTTAAPTTAAPSEPAPVSGSSTVTAVSASAARASGIDSCGQPTSYAPTNVLDGQLATAWMTQGDGTGQFLEFTLAPGAQLTQVGLVPGYAKQDPCSGSDRFHDMRRIVEVRWTFDGGNPVSQSLDPESPTMQVMQLPAAVSAATVRLTILTTTDAGTAGLDYAPVSEVTLA
jgi:hypothetical protein